MTRSTHLSVSIGLLVKHTTEHGFTHWTARPVMIGPTAYERRAIDEGRSTEPVDPHRIRNPRSEALRDYGENHPTLDLDNLVITCQGENTDTPRRLYGFEVRYQDVYAIDGARASRMARTLRTIERKIDKLNMKFGHPKQFGTYLARVAGAIGASRLVFAKTNVGWSYAENEHQFELVGHGADRVNAEIARWVAETAPAVPEQEVV